MKNMQDQFAQSPPKGEDLGKDTSPTTHVLKCQGNEPTYFNHINPSVGLEIEGRIKALHRTNKTYVSHTEVYIWQRKYQPN